MTYGQIRADIDKLNKIKCMYEDQLTGDGCTVELTIGQVIDIMCSHVLGKEVDIKINKGKATLIIDNQ